MLEKKDSRLGYMLVSGFSAFVAAGALVGSLWFNNQILMRAETLKSLGLSTTVQKLNPIEQNITELKDELITQKNNTVLLAQKFSEIDTRTDYVLHATYEAVKMAQLRLEIFKDKKSALTLLGWVVSDLKKLPIAQSHLQKSVETLQEAIQAIPLQDYALVVKKLHTLEDWSFPWDLRAEQKTENIKATQPLDVLKSLVHVRIHDTTPALPVMDAALRLQYEQNFKSLMFSAQLAAMMQDSKSYQAALGQAQQIINFLFGKTTQSAELEDLQKINFDTTFPSFEPVYAQYNLITGAKK